MATLTQEQKAAIYCVKHGHAKYFYQFFGYCYCGRCGEQIGDKLGGIFFGASEMAGTTCKDHPCKVCDPVIRELNKMDKEIFSRRKKHPTWDTEKILKGVKIA